MNYNVVLISLVHRKNFKELLLVKRKRNPGKGKWSLPGGFGALKKTRNPFIAIHREESMDFSVRSNISFFTLTFVKKPTPTLNLYFLVKLFGNPRIKKGSKSIQDYKWFPINDVLRLNLAFKEDKEIIKRFKRILC